MRGLEVLEIINEKPGTITKVHERTGLPRTTVHRIINTLVKSGHLIREEINGQNVYLATKRTKRLSSGANSYLEEYSSLKPDLNKLALEIGWPLYLTINDGFHMEIFDTTESQSLFYVRNTEKGDLIPLFRSASGLAFLASCNAEKRDYYLGRMDCFIDGPSEKSWIIDKILSSESQGYVHLENSDWLNLDRPVSNLSIGLKNRQGPYGALTVRYYASSSITKTDIDEWLKRLMEFRNELMNVSSAEIA